MNGLLYSEWIVQVPAVSREALIVAALIGLTGVLVFVALTYFNRLLRKEVRARTLELSGTNEELKRQQYYLEQAQEIGHIGTWELDLETNGLTWTTESYRIFGIPPGTQLTNESFLNVVHPDDRAYVAREWTASLKGKPYDIEHRIVADGKTKWVREKAIFISDEAGNLVRAIGFTQDVTERERLEREKVVLESDLRQAYKMEAVGTLAGGIAHDFNNILAIILGNTDLALDQNSSHDQSRANIEQIREAAMRAKDLVSQILSYSRQESPELLPIMLSLVVRNSLKMLRSTIPTTVELLERIPPDCESIKINGDPTRLHQVLINLCINAVHAMSASGTLVVRMETVFLESGDLPPRKDLRPGKYAKLSVRDTGEGMSPDVVKRIFDPYFTTKPLGAGTGMGLAVVHGIVEEHGAFVAVDSTPGNGSTFNVYLPVISDATKTDPAGPAEDLTGHENILFVDDEPMLADVGAALLSRKGFQVTSLTSSREALALFQADPDRFDLVFTDQTMPDLTGTELAAEMFKIRPDLPIILSTGYSRQVSEEDAAALGIRGFCMKPLNTGQMVDAIRKALDR